MPFSPPFCPRRTCRFNHTRRAGFARRHGRYRSSSHRLPVVRYRCMACRATFSVMTFRYAYRQKKPHVDAVLLQLVCSGVSLRGAARLLGVNRKTITRKLLRIGRHCRRQQHAVVERGRLRGHFQLDELETFESNRYQPVTAAPLIEKHSYFLAGLATAPLRRRGRMSPRQKAVRAAHERLHGRRPSRSDTAVRRCLAVLSRHTTGPLALDSDRKPSYGRIGRNLLGTRLRHHTFSATARRDHVNPLCAINHTHAMVRYCLARLRRRTWCVTRRRRCLELALHAYAGWFNFCRGITIKTGTSPAQSGPPTPRGLRMALLAARLAQRRPHPTPPPHNQTMTPPIPLHNSGGHFLVGCGPDPPPRALQRAVSPRSRMEIVMATEPVFRLTRCASSGG